MKNKLAKLGLFVVRKANKVVIVAKHYSPELLLAAGLIAGVATVVVACKATKHSDEVHEDHIQRLAEVRAEAEKRGEDRPSGRILLREYAKTVWNYVKLYGLSGALGALTTAFILLSYGIMKKRNTALIAAYTALQGVFERYRARVVDAFGEEADKKFRYGLKEKRVGQLAIDENGEETIRETTITDVDNDGVDSFVFDSSSPLFNTNSEFYNEQIIKSVFSKLDDDLVKGKEILCNDVRDMFKVKRNSNGCINGWVLGSGRKNMIEHRVTRLDIDPLKRTFSYLIELYPDGVVWDLVGKPKEAVANA